MRAVVAKALQLDPLLAEAHAALGMVKARDAQWEQAEKSFRRAIELEPSRSLTHMHFALYVLLPIGRVQEAVSQARLAEMNDPLSWTARSALAYTLFSAGRIDQAAAYCSKPCSRALVLQGKANEAIPKLEAPLKGDLTRTGGGDLGYAYALAGRREDAERIAALQPRAIEQAEVFVGLGDKDRAFEALDRAIPLGPVRIGRALTFPEFAPLRGDLRLKALRKRVGLPE
jgi:Flp pilus assembly protein TadD